MEPASRTPNRLGRGARFIRDRHADKCSDDEIRASIENTVVRSKRERLGISADGLWANNGQPYPHILPQPLQRLNILESIRREFWLYWELAGSVPLHRNFHHLNSSQALAFNLFFPYFGMPHGSAEPLLRGLGLEPRPVHAWAFEEVPEPEEGTNFDFFVAFGSGQRLLVEAKLTETEFGTCEADDAHRRKLTELYRPRLEAMLSTAVAEDVFFANYQLFRNVSHLGSPAADTLILLLPRANDTCWKAATSFKTLLTAEYSACVRVVALEDSAPNW